ncbi:hypothetical protein [Streptomyces sp. 769]|uniref:hypothetical protein n=1 Tax=Streptomyces sp. 769 TaxID=1262452 RepID=UPI00057DEEE8|nr:hypothetical protein [Streptomyces sp. 769]AJC54854.1 aldehyde dehydrogenase [Streptomyces sp. 769]
MECLPRRPPPGPGHRTRPAWYPGCEARVRSARDLHSDAEKPGGTPQRTLLTGLDLPDPDESTFSTGYFGPVLGVAELPGTGTQFLDSAVTVANDRLHGTPGASLIATSTPSKPSAATWGAFPGHPLDNVQGGIGGVHN